MKVQKEGFQNRAGEALLEKGGSASVRYWYTRTVLSKFASDAMSNTLRQHTHRYQSPLFELPYSEGSKHSRVSTKKMTHSENE